MNIINQTSAMIHNDKLIQASLTEPLVTADEVFSSYELFRSEIIKI